MLVAHYLTIALTYPLFSARSAWQAALQKDEQQALTVSTKHNIPFCLSTVSISSIEELQVQTNKAC